MIKQVYMTSAMAVWTTLALLFRHEHTPQTPERITGMMDFMTISVCTWKRETKESGVSSE
jgi:hypothetical protein